MQVLLVFGLIAQVFSRVNRSCQVKSECSWNECVDGICVTRDSRCDLFGCSSSTDACFNETRSCVRRDSKCDLFGCSFPSHACLDSTCISKDLRCDLFPCTDGAICQGTTCISPSMLALNHARAIFIGVCCGSLLIFCIFLAVRAFRNRKLKVQGTIATTSPSDPNQVGFYFPPASPDLVSDGNGDPSTSLAMIDYPTTTSTNPTTLQPPAYSITTSTNRIASQPPAYSTSTSTPPPAYPPAAL
jgi:hypothetical protein